MRYAGRIGARGCESVRGMQEESLIDEMRDALRGDRERAEARRHSAPAEETPEERSDEPVEVERRGFLARFRARPKSGRV